MTKFAIVALAFLLAADATIDFSCNCSNCVEEPFKEHVNSFENEARLRRVKACVCDVTMVADTSIYSLNDDGFVIQCAALTIDTARIILVDTTSNNWILNPESLIYHELGHLILLRNDEVEMFNDDFPYPFDYPKSIMHKRAIPPYFEGEEFKKIRKYYLDELFNR